MAFVKARLTRERIEELLEEKPALELVKLHAPNSR
jgi:hypothetical protein